MASTLTNRETEIKLPVSDLSALLGSLQDLGAVGRGRVLEQNTLYDTPEFDLRRAGCLLRLRLETPAGSSLVPPGLASAVLTSKAPPGGERHTAGRRAAKPRYKERLERELTVQRPARWSHTLEILGFRPGFRYQKYRTSFRLSGLHVDLDETPVGNFLELEGLPKAIERVASALGYTHRDFSRATYWELYNADCQRKGRVLGNMMFDT
ncbi:MAG: class IV adenylate cyclase [Candidatus Acidiferrales bacterium]